MPGHVITIDERLVRAVDNHGQPYITAASRYRWRCSCERIAPRWSRSRGHAAAGGQRHAAMTAAYESERLARAEVAAFQQRLATDPIGALLELDMLMRPSAYVTGTAIEEHW